MSYAQGCIQSEAVNALLKYFHLLTALLEYFNAWVSFS